jgi:hypothetical protein
LKRYFDHVGLFPDFDFEAMPEAKPGPLLAEWDGEDDARPAAAKAVLKTMEGVNWQAAPEPKKPLAHRRALQLPPYSNHNR